MLKERRKRFRHGMKPEVFSGGKAGTGPWSGRREREHSLELRLFKLFIQEGC